MKCGDGQFTKYWLNVAGNGRSRECSVVINGQFTKYWLNVAGQGRTQRV